MTTPQMPPIKKRRVDRDVDTLSRRLEQLTVVTPAARDNLTEQRSLIPVLAAKWPDGAPRSRGSHSDPTLRAIQLDDAITYRLTAIDDAIATLKLAVNMLDDELAGAVAFRTPIDANQPDPPEQTPRCIGTGEPDGSTCTQIPIPRTNLQTEQQVDDRRCIDCGTLWDQAQQRKSEDTARRRALRHMKESA